MANRPAYMLMPGYPDPDHFHFILLRPGIWMKPAVAERKAVN
jgi:hypothetical protein